VGTRGFGGVNRSELYVRLPDIHSRAFSIGRLWRGLLRGDPGEAFRGNFSQRDVMLQVRKDLLPLVGDPHNPDLTLGVRKVRPTISTFRSSAQTSPS
jgi:HAE1 family hydrophobic/amphiphilic exporter-1